MKIKTVIEMPDGNYEFTANLTADQHSFLLEYAIRDMMLKGLIPFASVGEDNDIGKYVSNLPNMES